MVTIWTYDELVLAGELAYQNGWKGVRARTSAAIDLSALLNAAPLHPLPDRERNFRSPNSVQRKTYDIATQKRGYSGKPTKGNQLDRVVLSHFVEDPGHMTKLAAEIRAVIISQKIRAVPEWIDWDDIPAPEGRLLFVRHLQRESDSNRRLSKIEQARAHGHPVACEVCDFNFEATYGALGTGSIEVHHTRPLLAPGPEATRLADLALLCSNCHHIIHRSSPWLTIEQLRQEIA